MIFELAAFRPESLHKAFECGVRRVEFCADYASGGITPERDVFENARRAFKGEFLVMIRPRSGNFIYSDDELHSMLESIAWTGEAGADGFVLGCLQSNGNIDISALHRLMQAAGDKPVTFHRAIDHTSDYVGSIQQLIDSGVKRVLTSGNTSSAANGKQMLKRIVEEFNDRIEIIAGGGVRSGNIRELVRYTGVKAVHSAAVTTATDLADLFEIEKILSELNIFSL